MGLRGLANASEVQALRSPESFKTAIARDGGLSSTRFGQGVTRVVAEALVSQSSRGLAVQAAGV
jgi:hypothetical protein